MRDDDADASFALTGNDDERASGPRKAQSGEIERLRQTLLLLQGPLAHEFRTPINTIMGFAGILLMESDGTLTQEQRRQILFIEDAAKELLGMTNEIFELTRLAAAPHQNSTGKTIHLDDLVNDAVQFCKSLAGTRDINVEVVSSQAAIQSDPRICRQIARSIMSALLRLTEADCIRVSAAADAQGAVLQFACQKAALKEDGITDLFVPFSRLAVAEQFAIVGLGFFLARQLAVYIDGDLAVISSADEPLMLELKLANGSL